MLALMKRQRLWPPLVALGLALAVALYALLSLGAVPGLFQYLWSAPAPVAQTYADGTTGDAANDGLRTARTGMADLRETLSGACEPVMLSAVIDGVSVIAERDGAEAATARLTALDDGGYALAPLVLKTGRLIYTDEFQLGTRVAIVNEKLAVALFNYAEPIDRTLLLGGKRYRIVGIADEQRGVGDRLTYSLYIPYRAAEESNLTFDALCLTAKPVRGSGGWAAFSTATAALNTRGTLISLPKETMAAALPLRVLGCTFAAMALWFALRALGTQVRRLHAAYRERLREQYAARLLPWLLLRGLPLALGYALCAYLFAQVFVVLVAPVYTFPEWIPKVLVEPNDIAEAFWNVWTGQAALAELRSPQLLRVRFFQRLLAWACGAMGIAAALLAARLGALLTPPPTETRQ